MDFGRLHADFTGPVNGTMLLIVVDCFFKWIEAILMRSTTTARTVHELSVLFSRFGLPLQLCTDNGPQFTSDWMASFVRRHGIRHIRVASYHPSSNGLVERAVRTVKERIKAVRRDDKSMEESLLTFLLNYRSTPLSTTGKTPANMLLGRNIRSKLALLIPDEDVRMAIRQEQQGRQYSRVSHLTHLDLTNSYLKTLLKLYPTFNLTIQNSYLTAIIPSAWD